MVALLGIGFDLNVKCVFTCSDFGHLGLGCVSPCVLPESLLSPLRPLKDSFFQVAFDSIYTYFNFIHILIALERLSEAVEKAF